MNVLSLFDGMSCGRIALDRAEIPVTNYYASEIDKYATKVSEANYPDIIRLGDVTDWRNWSIDWASIDLILAGSPCQGFSFAGKQLAFDDPRSALFFTFVDILNKVEDEKDGEVNFLLENVRMKKEFLAVISDCVGVDPVPINSALVSAQNRQRYYWSNWDFGVPSDLGFLLRDIMEPEPKNYVLMSDKFVNRQKGRKCLVDSFDRKASSLSAMEYVKNGRQGDYVQCDSKGDVKNQLRKDIVEGKIKTKLAFGSESQTLDRAIKNFRVGDEKANCLLSGPPGRGFGMACNGVTNVVSNNEYRKLTPIECERLQTVPDNYTNHVSNTQRYKMLGNGWTIDVIAHILKGLNL